MKKIILIFIILFIISCVYYACSSLYEFLGADYMSFDEISQLYNKNSILFDNIANEFIDFPEGIRIERKTIGNDEKGRDDWLYYDKDGFWVISTTGEILTENILTKIDNLPLKKFFRKTKIDKIDKEHKSVSFIQASNLYFCVGIIFNLQNEPPNQYIYKWRNIKDNWYFFEQK